MVNDHSCNPPIACILTLLALCFKFVSVFVNLNKINKLWMYMQEETFEQFDSILQL